MIQKKVCMLGGYAVGKTSLVRQFVQSIFDDSYLTTVGVKVDKKEVELDGETVKLMLWDIGGAEDLFDIPMPYVRGSSGYLLVLDGTRAQTLESALDIVEQVENAFGDIPKVACINKCDLEDDWVLDDAALAPLKQLGCPILITSAKSGQGVEEAFEALALLVTQPA